MSSPDLTQLNDQQLLDLYYLRRDNIILGELLQRYTLLLFGVCMKYLKNEEEAKDAVQQIYLKVITEIPKYRVEYFKSWIYMVARNYCLMQLRDKGKNFAALNEKMLAQEEEENKKYQLLQDDKIFDWMNESLHELNPEQQQCVTLFYLNKKSYQEISDETGFTMMQVKSYIQNGKRNMRILIEKKREEENNN